MIHLVKIRITSSLRKRNRNNNLPRAFMSMVNYFVLSKLIHFESRGKIPGKISELFYDSQTYLDINKYHLRKTSQNIMWHIFWFCLRAYEMIRNHFQQNNLVTAKHLSALTIKSLRVARTL